MNWEVGFHGINRGRAYCVVQEPPSLANHRTTLGAATESIHVDGNSCPAAALQLHLPSALLQLQQVLSAPTVDINAGMAEVIWESCEVIALEMIVAESNIARLVLIIAHKGRDGIS